MAAIDRLYRNVLLAARFFSKGWGPTSAYESLAKFNSILTDQSDCATALQQHHHSITLKQIERASWGSRFTGSFLSPVATLLPDLLPPPALVARFELLLPNDLGSTHKPIYIHLAGTGDHGFYRRRKLTGLPLLKKEKFGALILENPYYGSRKPPEQTLSQLLHVSDLFVMGSALMLECVVLKSWLERKGLGPVGLTGASMGGHNASLAAAIWPEGVPVVPFLSWSTASSAFTQGMLSGAVCWDVLEDQLLHTKTSSDKIRKKIFDFAIDQLNDQEGRYHSRATGSNERPPLGSECRSDTSTTRIGTNPMAPPPEMLNFTSQEDPPGFCKGEDKATRTEPPVRAISNCHHSWLSTKRSREKSPLHQETVLTLKALLDLSTHLYHYPVPKDSSLAKFVVADHDLYIPRQHITHVQDVWPGCEVRTVKGGHVTATILQQQAYRDTLVTKMQEKLSSL